MKKTASPTLPFDGASVQTDTADSTSDYHLFKAGNTTFTLPKQYTFVKLLGIGRFSVSILANDTVRGKTVSIRKFAHAFEDPQDAVTTLSELHVRRLLKHENVSELLQ